MSWALAVCLADHDDQLALDVGAPVAGGWVYLRGRTGTIREWITDTMRGLAKTAPSNGVLIELSATGKVCDFPETASVSVVMSLPLAGVASAPELVGPRLDLLHWIEEIEGTLYDKGLAQMAVCEGAR